MKFNYCYIVCLLVLSACTKIKVETPDFSVTAEKTDYKVNDTVRFIFNGSVQNITFYSGETGKKYEYKDRINETGIPQLQFTSYQQNTGETNTLQLLASTDFNGTYTSEAIAAATWTDISSRAVLSTGADNTASGNINLADFFNPENKPLFLAFKYQGYTHAVLKQPTWTIRTFNVTNTLNDGKKSVITAIDNVGWYNVDYKNPIVKWAVASTGQVTINGTQAGSDNSANDDWTITRPLQLKSVTPDAGVPIQFVSSAVLKNYSYKYTIAGTYKVSFLAYNNGGGEQKEVVREIVINVKP
ncbi:hypothetical protein HDC92_004892 [Pedobacter sp. AK017]|uniref:DUF5017 domain-containing protein n=1 Tax=Pedobacter sp. AK017 TaxID=2723073 RepID=UPI001617247B|nr:DUF5017 domain-containing protein [Pedobacter sp. AK017]MBB5441185.1 hypothetical protein [Pedobacter sp. AK017]